MVSNEPVSHLTVNINHFSVKWIEWIPGARLRILSIIKPQELALTKYLDMILVCCSSKPSFYPLIFRGQNSWVMSPNSGHRSNEQAKVPDLVSPCFLLHRIPENKTVVNWNQWIIIVIIFLITTMSDSVAKGGSRMKKIVRHSFLDWRFLFSIIV